MVKSNRSWILGAVLISVIVIAVGWFLGVQPQLAAGATATAEARNLDDQNGLQQLELARLKAQDEAIVELEAELAGLEKSIPSSSLLEEYTAELFRTATANGLTVIQIDYADAAIFAPTPAFVERVPAGVALENFVSVPFSISLGGPRDNLNAFLGAIQKGSRLTIVSDLTFAQGPDATSWGMDVTGTVFVLFGPGDSPQTVVPVDPAADPAATPAPTDPAPPTPTPTATP